MQTQRFTSPANRLAGKTFKISEFAELIWSKTDQRLSLRVKLPNGEWSHKSGLGKFLKHTDEVMDEKYRNAELAKFWPLAILAGNYVSGKVSLKQLVDGAALVGLSASRAKTLVTKTTSAIRADLVNTNPSGFELRP